ncbi:MAG: NAD(P)-dependent oxidoreductase [Chloroflexi bacterium]|nr:NAD(P)-dependent oxidoreductase [Chloroflexota bacterium]
MKVLVTGGSGRLGGYILRDLLAHGHTVSSCGRTPPTIAEVPHISADIGSLESTRQALAGQDAVVHLAAVAHPKRGTPEQITQANIVGTFNVLEAAALEGVGKVVFGSTEATYGFPFSRLPVMPRYLPIDEEYPCEPEDEYGLSKLVGELMCKRYSAACGLRTLCIRICTAWHLDRAGTEIAVRSGPWRKAPKAVEELWGQYREQLERPEGPFPIPGPAAPRHRLWSVTDARDTAQALRLAVENNSVQHGVFLTTGDDTCSCEETPALIARYFPDVPLRAPLKGYATLYSNEKAKRVLGYRPQHTWRHGDFSDWMERGSH